MLVTGAAGFLGFHVARRLLDDGRAVVGVDDLDGYYDPRLKEARLARLTPRPGFRFERLDLAEPEPVERLFAAGGFREVVHLAAQPGVRHSLVDPRAYLSANVSAFLNVLEGCRARPVAHLVYASSSSVYGANAAVPSSTQDGVDHPLSLYAATKRADELMAHVYAHLFRVPATGLRFFTVYGPWGRPDMAPMLFLRAILEGRPIEVFNEGRMRRDFTYVDDVVEAVVRVLARPPAPDPAFGAAAPTPDRSRAPFRVYNVGHGDPVDLLEFVETLERLLGRRAQRIMRPMQPGDVVETYADVSDLERDVGYRPRTSLQDGLRALVEWYLDFASAPRARPPGHPGGAAAPGMA